MRPVAPQIVCPSAGYAHPRQTPPVRTWQLHRFLDGREPGERHADDLLDLCLRGEQIRRQPQQADERDHEDRGDVRVHRRERTDQLRKRGVEADLFERLPASGVGGRLSLVHEPSGERDLSRVSRQRVGADREDHRALRRLDERCEYGGEAVARRRLVRRRRVQRGTQHFLQRGRVYHPQPW